MTSFHDFGLAEPINRALADENYVTPTPIQSQTIPLVLEGRDVVGIAQTGTGKTAAFALPILNHLNAKRFRPERKTCRVLVLSPTRELSGQIADSFATYGKNIRPLDIALAIGGVPIKRQIRALQNGVEVFVATPGRLLDLAQQRAVRLDKIEVLVLDEADRMLDMGFIRDIRKIVAMLPKDRQTLFFSATMPQEIAKLAGEMLRDPARVAVTPQATTAERVNQRVIHTDKAGKQSLLAEVLNAEPFDRAIVFTRTKHGADKVVRGLAKSGIDAHAIHGNKSQNHRERTLAAFRDGSVRVLVATDIAARGIDVDGVSHVINYDLPNVPESYVHRIGRTARAGAEGAAISFCDREEAGFLRDIERTIRMKIPATDRRQPGGHQTSQAAAPQSEPAHGHRNGHRAHGHGNGRNGDGRRGQGQGHGNGEGHRGGKHRRNDRHDRNGRPNGERHQQNAQGRNAGGKPDHGGREGQHPVKFAAPQNGERGRHGHSAAAPHNEAQPNGIETVTFMQRQTGPRRGGSRRAPV
ncbi:MAG: DEAD/DEAH box helicase [Xanthobacteraceae bacterium]|uniref:DEAD/DEAH box helicase n=1 Tax=Pseudolabrys sp. TaxID=1960880 RepID=UPI003D0FCBD8